MGSLEDSKSLSGTANDFGGQKTLRNRTTRILRVWVSAGSMTCCRGTKSAEGRLRKGVSEKDGERMSLRRVGKQVGKKGKKEP